MIELDVARYLAQLKSITPELAREFRFPALFTFAGARTQEALAYAQSQWQDENNPAPYRHLCLRTARYLTVLETIRKNAPDFQFWTQVYGASTDADCRLECILACYGSDDEGVWELVRSATSERTGKLRAFALEVAGAIVRLVPPRRAAGMALIKYNLAHGNPWNRLGALMGYSVAGLRGDGLTTELMRFIEVEWDETLRHLAIALLSRVMEKDAFVSFATDLATRAPLPACTQAVLFQFVAQAHPTKAQSIAAQTLLDPKAAGPLANAAAQVLAAQAAVGPQVWENQFKQALLGVD